MRNGDDCPGSGNAGNGFLDLLLRFHINRRGRFIQDNNRRLSQNSPCDGDPLFLPAGKPQAAFAYLGIITVRHRQDILMDIGCPGCLPDFLHGRFRHSVADILRDGPVEQESILQHRGYTLPQAFQRHPADIMAVNQNPARSRFIKAGNQLGQCGFAHSRGSHQRQHLSGLTVE